MTIKFAVFLAVLTMAILVAIFVTCLQIVQCLVELQKINHSLKKLKELDKSMGDIYSRLGEVKRQNACQFNQVVELSNDVNSIKAVFQKYAVTSSYAPKHARKLGKSHD